MPHSCRGAPRSIPFQIPRHFNALWAEVLINEEIMEVTIGALKFNGEYQGGMPTLVCPGCQGETKEYVEEDA